MYIIWIHFAETTGAARKDGGEYWTAVMKDRPMPEALKGLVRIKAASAGSHVKTKCHTPADFEPRPNISAYGGDDGDNRGKNIICKH
ncbi:hypothetical protein J1N35_042151 [Gossypium stocksii]|uniref:Uncharacterized protein n=1 Tax=Gossypium stocksii TaxID=47602 RepID=A0A9D3ZK20_9ROSI|nr:hypothetical protein J1N35_042151 [Gossypium stocksii]